MTVGRLAALGIVALACAGTLAQQAASPERLALEQREALVRRLVFDSPAEQRIAASGNEEARGLFARARAHHARARALADTGSLAEAQSELSAAMRAVGKARQLVPDTHARAVDQRARVASLVQSVETLARSYESHLARAQVSVAGSPPGDARLNGARTRLDEAKSLANSGHAAEAVAALEKAERELMAGLNALLGSSTLLYSQRFETPAEEFAFERERNKSYRELVPRAISELKPRREAVALIERYVAENARYLEIAEAHAAGQRYREAGDAMRSGTSSLQAALAAAGLSMPWEHGAN